MKKASIALIGLALVAAVLYSVRGPLSTALMGRALERAMSANLLDSLPDGLNVVLCGAGGPLPDPVRSGGCVAVFAGDNMVIVDAGTGGARNLNPMGLPIGQVDAVFLTHFHSDHIDGLGEMATLRWASAGHKEPLPVHGPEGLEEVVSGFNQSYAMDANYRHAHHGDTVAPLSGHGMQAVMHPLPPEGEAVVVYENEGLVVKMIKVEHKPVEPAVAYLFTYKDRSALVSGDTVKSANLQKFAQGVDLLVHEGLSQLKSLISFARTKHLRSKCESHFDPRRLRRLTGCYASVACMCTFIFFAIAPSIVHADWIEPVSDFLLEKKGEWKVIPNENYHEIPASKLAGAEQDLMFKTLDRVDRSQIPYFGLSSLDCSPGTTPFILRAVYENAGEFKLFQFQQTVIVEHVSLGEPSGLKNTVILACLWSEPKDVVSLVWGYI